MIEELHWNSEDVNIFRQFLDSRTGQKLVPRLAEATPTLFSEGEVNKLLIRSGEVRGVQLILNEIFSLANPPPSTPKEITEYPSLTDDSAWPETPKLNL